MLDWQSTTEYVIEEKLEGNFQDFSLQTLDLKMRNNTYPS